MNIFVTKQKKMSWLDIANFIASVATVIALIYAAISFNDARREQSLSNAIHAFDEYNDASTEFEEYIFGQKINRFQLPVSDRLLRLKLEKIGNAVVSLGYLRRHGLIDGALAKVVLGDFATFLRDEQARGWWISWCRNNVFISKERLFTEKELECE